MRGRLIKATRKKIICIVTKVITMMMPMTTRKKAVISSGNDNKAENIRKHMKVKIIFVIIPEPVAVTVTQPS